MNPKLVTLAHLFRSMEQIAVSSRSLVRDIEMDDDMEEALDGLLKEIEVTASRLHHDCLNGGFQSDE